MTVSRQRRTHVGTRTEAPRGRGKRLDRPDRPALPGWMRGLAMACGLAVALAGCSSKDEKFAEHMERAEKYLAEGQDKEALVELRSALQLDPKSAETSWRIAEVMRKQGKAADAIFFYREVSRLDPSRTDAMLLEASLLYGDDLPRATELVEGVLAKEPGNPAAHLRKSEISMLKGDVDEALAQALTATQLDPKSGLYQQQVGIVHRTRIREKNLKGEKVDEALFRSAIEAFEKADQLDGPYWAYRIERARVYATWPGHVEEAKQAYRAAVESAIESDDQNADAAALTEARNYAVTVKDAELLRWSLETMTKVRPADVAAWVEMARLEESEGRDGEATYRRMLEQNASSVDAHVAYANWLIAEQRPDDAVAHLEKTLAAGGVDAPMMLGALANVQLRLGRFDDAKKTIDRMRGEYVDHPRTTLAMVQLAVTEGRMADAAKLLREDTGLQENPEALRMLAFCEMMQANLPAATQAINRAAELSPRFEPSIVRLQAQIQHLSNDYPSAARSYRRLLQNNVELDTVEDLRFVQSLYQTGRGPAGKARLDALLAKPDAPPEVALEYAFREADADPAKAIEVLEKSLAAHPGEPRLLDYLTNLDARAGRSARALERLNQTMAQQGVTAGLLLVRGRLLASMGLWAEAENDIRATFEAAPKYPGVSDLLVTIYQKQNKLDEAIASLQKADQAKTLGGAQLYLLGRLMLEKGDAADAQAIYERVLQAEPDNASAQNDLAFLLADRGENLERALELAQSAQKSRANDPSVADTLGFIYYKKGMNDPAIQQLRYAIELAGQARRDRPEFHHHLGLALAAASRPDEARAAFDKALALDPAYAPASEAKRKLDEQSQAAQTGTTNPS